MPDQARDPAEYVPLPDFWLHILLVLGDGPSHGYAIGKKLEESSEGRLTPTTGTLYHALRRLHEEGLIAEANAPARDEGKGPQRQYFKLTRFGRRVFAVEANRLQSLLTAARRSKLVPGHS
jgi:DNA-binding PadR family transcriptional regulator